MGVKMKEITIVKGIMAVATGVLGTFFKAYGMIILFLGIVILLDLISGLLRSSIKGNLSSKIGRKGCLKKLSLILMLGVGIFIDFFIPLLLESGINVTINIVLPFGMIIGCYLIMTELISIIENLTESGVPIPRFVISLLKKLKKNIDEKQ